MAKTFLADLKSLGRALFNLAYAFKGDPPPPDEPEAMPPQLLLPVGKPNFDNAQLLTEHTEGWHVPHPHALAAPSYAPAMVAFGLVFLALGAVTMWPLSVIGAIIFFLAVAKWIGELLND